MRSSEAALPLFVKSLLRFPDSALLVLPNVRHERRRKGREAAFGASARWRG